MLSKMFGLQLPSETSVTVRPPCWLGIMEAIEVVINWGKCGVGNTELHRVKSIHNTT